MPIFGQVWLWSSLAFLLGAFLCWALVARPARKRAGQLQAELNSRARRQGPPQRPDRRRRSLDEQYDAYDAGRGADRDAPRTAVREPVRETPDPREETFGDLRAVPPETPAESSEPLTRAYALPQNDSGLPTREPGKNSRRSLLGGQPPSSDNTDTELADGPASATSYFDLSGGSLEAPPEVPSQPERRGWFDSDAASGEPLEGAPKLEPFSPGELGVGRLVDDEAEQSSASSGGTIFNQHTHPIPGEVIREIDEAGKAEARTDEPADGLVDDLADLDSGGGKHEQIVAPEPAATSGESELGKQWATELTSQPASNLEATTVAPDPGAAGRTEVMPVIPRDDAPPEPVPATGRSVTDEAPAPPGVTAPADPASAPLPKRVPGKPRGHTPFGVQTSRTPEPEPAAPGAAGQVAEPEPTRSLFEPIVPAEDSEVVPPPHRVRGGNGRGPFGPGSAMPLPDGGSPSPEFTIKASVSALRYCTPESPQFGRTVAEVWFKSPADAERVGFRPVS